MKLGLLGLLFGSAHAGTVVLAPGQADSPAVAAAVEAGGLTESVRLRDDVWLAGVSVVGLTAREADEDCGGAVIATDWRGRLAAAELALQRLDLDAALAGFVTLELEAACLGTAPSQADLLRVQLGLATVHHLEARSSGGSRAARDAHARERDLALSRAAVWGAGLAIPATLDADIRARLDAARASLDESPPAWVALTGPAAGGLRIDGRTPDSDPFVLPPGTHLVQVVVAGGVAAAELVTLPPDGHAVLRADPGGPAWDTETLRERWASLGHEDDRDRDELLAAVARLDGGDVVYLADVDGEVRLYDVDGLALVARGGKDSARRREPAHREAAWSVGLGGVGAASSVRGGALDGLGGAALGYAAWGTFEAAGLAFSVDATLAGVPSRVPVNRGGGLLFRATLPVRAGVRWGTDLGAVRLSGGPDLGLHVFGPYDGRFRLSPLVGGAAELSGAGAPVGWRARLTAAGGMTRASEGGGPYGVVALELGAELAP